MNNSSIPSSIISKMSLNKGLGVAAGLLAITTGLFFLSFEKEK